MYGRPANRPEKAESWPKQYRKLTMELKTEDKIFFRSVNARDILAGVCSENSGRPCPVITGHKEFEGLQKAWGFRNLEKFSGSSVALL